MEVESTDSIVAEYHSYIESIRSRLLPSLRALHENVSLHDSKVRGFLVNLPAQVVSMTLHGFVDPWSPEGLTGRRIDLRYSGVTTIQSINPGESASEALDDSDLGYAEIEVLADGLWEHRMLFASGIELRIQFRDLQLQHGPLISETPNALSP
jgi:hypothetical protein